jgi:NitT/TauT family transport system substrate-binding protein
MRRRDFSIAMFGLAAFASVGEAARAEETVKVSVPQRGAWDTGVTELGQRSGIFGKHGLAVEILYTQGGAESIQAVISGSMDIATGAGVSAAVSAYAKGAPIRLIGSEMIGSPDLFWYVPPGSPVKQISDLNDRTIAYSITGSSSHAALLELLQQYKLTAKPVSAGGMQATLTQTMTGQVDIGWAAAPFALDLLEQGKIRLVARGTDVDALRNRTVRVNVTNLDTLTKHRDTLDRFMQAYRETIDWMYADPAALKYYADFSGLPEKIVARVREFIPKDTILPEHIVGMDQIIADAVKLKFLSSPLTPQQIAEMVQIAQPLK